MSRLIEALEKTIAVRAGRFAKEPPSDNPLLRMDNVR
jgi:hypothetical protein